MKRIDKNRSMLANKIFLVFRAISERKRFRVNYYGEIEFSFPVIATDKTSKYRGSYFRDSLFFRVKIGKVVGSDITGRVLFEITQTFQTDSLTTAFHKFNKMDSWAQGYKIDEQRQILVESIGWLAEFENFFRFLGIEPDFERFNESEYLKHHSNERIG